MDPRFKEKVEEKILNGERIKEYFDLTDPIDQYILTRLAYYRFAIPLMKILGTNMLNEDTMNNCIIDMYVELRTQGRLYTPPHKRIT